MTLESLELDDRKYADILQEAVARIPVHNPEWTNFNDSDPGITLLQLFSFLTESLAYRANLMPERNYAKFLKLLGLERKDAATARGMVTFNNSKGQLKADILPAQTELKGGAARFRTTTGLEVLPIEMQVYYKAPASLTPAERDVYLGVYASHETPDVSLEFYETRLLAPPTSIADLPVVDLHDDRQVVDGYLWVALLARDKADVEATRKAIANRVLTVGVVPAIAHTARVIPPVGLAQPQEESSLIFELPNVEAGAVGDITRTAGYRALNATFSTDLTFAPGVVQLELPDEQSLTTWSEEAELEMGVGALPPALDDSATSERLVTWLRVRPGRQTVGSGNQLALRLSYLGANAAMVEQRTGVFAELLGKGNGEPDQEFTFVNTPVLRDSVQLRVGEQLWEQIDDLYAAGPEVPRREPSESPGTQRSSGTAASKVYTLDRKTGLIQFGNGLRGARPPQGAVIQASYDYGGGLQGLVGIGEIKSGQLPTGMKVVNPIPTWGAEEEESVEEARRRVTNYLRHRDRLVSEQDFKDIARETPGIDIGRVEVLPLYYPDPPYFPAEGVVTVMVIPRRDAIHPDAPRPDQLFLDVICRHLSPRRLITTELHVRGPEYVPVIVSVGIEAVPGRSIGVVRQAVKDELRRFLSPLNGELDGTGWRLNHDVDVLELVTVAARVDGVLKVNQILLGELTGDPRPTVEIEGLKLPRLAGIEAQSGPPQTLEQLRGDGGDEPDGKQRVPVPVVPDEC